MKRGLNDGVYIGLLRTLGECTCLMSNLGEYKLKSYHLGIIVLVRDVIWSAVGNHMVVSQNKGPRHRLQNTIILLIVPPEMVPLILGTSISQFLTNHKP